ncbi:PDR/VanB family oxidoreductase [Limnohabitans sp. Rim8]|jgi:vanillate O-demethylase ferredoxin subunit|uniref:PDR/VanB family oxidoreductase n=1 Tax=Limnohabitans sp. Rim8 TaxID=1100718 RepID=UPI0025EBCA00|nr:PDR/VanB family oxidoreductase [Limnohabitans sp. Rim8]
MNPASAGFTELAVVNWSIQGANVLVAELSRLDGTELPKWEAGAHIDIKAIDRKGHGVVRQYSLCSRHGESNWRIAVLGDPHGSGASLNLQNDIKAGQTLKARGPRNFFALQSDDHPVVLVAGGIGITPILAMAETLSSQKRKFRLHYHARSHERAAFVDELKSSSYAGNVTFSFDDENSSGIAEIFSDADAHAWLYTCGPAGFMNAVMGAAKAAGVQDTKIRKELFGGSTESISGGSVPMDQAFTIKIQSTGAMVEVPVGLTAVQALSAAGIEVLVSCEQGHCGSCLTSVLEGTPDHRDQFMLPEEHEKNDAFTPCCSRSLTPCLVLDL